MSNRPILTGNATVEIDLTRYDELLHKEALFDNIIEKYRAEIFVSDIDKKQSCLKTYCECVLEE